jgi:hypothetical protein
MMTTAAEGQYIEKVGRLYVSFELGWRTWKLGFTTGRAQKARVRTMPARDLEADRDRGPGSQAAHRPVALR